LRAKGVAPQRAETLAREVAASNPGLILSLHGDDLAAHRAGCFGVHFPSNEIPRCKEACPSLCVGASCHDGGEIELAHVSSADYGFLSPVFTPLSKPDNRPVLGVEGFSRFACATELPLFALGGMKPEHSAAICGAGGAGVAVMGSIFLDDDVEASAATWVEAVFKSFGRK
jgi:thiamine monophosphate synthase